MDKASASEPDTDERRDELTETDAVTGPQHVQVLQHVRYGH